MSAPARPASPYADVDMASNADPDAISVLFVCLGNICRASPAESPRNYYMYML